ncbi:MAG: ABC transporter ATP-binding protein [Candidatus Diapherotrites archaeon]
MKESAISIKGLTKTYGKLKAVNNISLEIEEGEFFGYLGPNGAGKTTTINAIVGLLNFDKGSVRVFGNDVVKDYVQARKIIGFAQQELMFDPLLSVRDILHYHGGYFEMKGEILERMVEKLMRDFGIKKNENDTFRRLSGGMKRRLQIAKALIHDPKILVLDEPSAGVDVELRHNLWRYLSRIHKEGKTILLTTHYIEEAEKLCERIGVINRGKIVALDRKENMLRELSEQMIKIDLKEKIDKVPESLKNFRCDLDVKKGRITVKCKNAQSELANIMRNLDKENLEVINVDIVKDNLESIYIKLTGEKNELNGL